MPRPTGPPMPLIPCRCWRQRFGCLSRAVKVPNSRNRFSKSGTRPRSAAGARPWEDKFEMLDAPLDEQPLAAAKTLHPVAATAGSIESVYEVQYQDRSFAVDVFHCPRCGPPADRGRTYASQAPRPLLEAAGIVQEFANDDRAASEERRRAASCQERADEAPSHVGHPAAERLRDGGPRRHPRTRETTRRNGRDSGFPEATPEPGMALERATYVLPDLGTSQWPRPCFGCTAARSNPNESRTLRRCALAQTMRIRRRGARGRDAFQIRKWMWHGEEPARLQVAAGTAVSSVEEEERTEQSDAGASQYSDRVAAGARGPA